MEGGKEKVERRKWKVAKTIVNYQFSILNCVTSTSLIS